MLLGYTVIHILTKTGPSCTHRHGSSRECLPQSDNVWSDPRIVTRQTSANLNGTHRHTYQDSGYGNTQALTDYTWQDKTNNATSLLIV